MQTQDAMKEQTLRTKLDSALKERDTYRTLLNKQRTDFMKQIAAMKKLMVLQPAVERAES
jgi:hypothetical protein